MDEEDRTEVMMIDNPFKVGKTQWAKWRDAARLMFNRSMGTGMGFSASFEAAQEVNEHCIKNNIRVGLGPITEEKPEEPVEAEEPAAEKPKKAPAKRRQAKKD
jgi:hypothetical protein